MTNPPDTTGNASAGGVSVNYTGVSWSWGSGTCFASAWPFGRVCPAQAGCLQAELQAPSCTRLCLPFS